MCEQTFLFSSWIWSIISWSCKVKVSQNQKLISQLWKNYIMESKNFVMLPSSCGCFLGSSPAYSLNSANLLHPGQKAAGPTTACSDAFVYNIRLCFSESAHCLQPYFTVNENIKIKCHSQIVFLLLCAIKGTGELTNILNKFLYGRSKDTHLK